MYGVTLWKKFVEGISSCHGTKANALLHIFTFVQAICQWSPFDLNENAKTLLNGPLNSVLKGG